MDINSISSISAYNYQSNLSKNDSAQKVQASKEEKADTAAVYEKSESSDRSALIAQLKADAEAHTTQLKNLVMEMMGQQGQAFGLAQEEDNIWSFLASGNYTVSEAAKAQAKEAISEGGYWSVDETSKRIVEFAKALTGGDSTKAEAMRKAFEKGYAQATKTWGKELPSISKDTYDATEKLFDDWAAGGESE